MLEGGREGRGEEREEREERVRVERGESEGVRGGMGEGERRQYTVVSLL